MMSGSKIPLGFWRSGKAAASRYTHPTLRFPSELDDSTPDEVVGKETSSMRGLPRGDCSISPRAVLGSRASLEADRHRRVSPLAQ